MKTSLALVVIAVLGCVLGERANAVLVGYKFHPTPSSSISITIDILGAGGGATTDVTGSASGVLDNVAGPHAAAIRFDNMQLSLSDETFLIPGPPLFFIEAATIGVGASGRGPLVAATPISATESIADIGGTSLVLDRGVITYAATAGVFSTGLPPSTLDFDAEPLPITLPSGSTVKISQEPVVLDRITTIFIPLAVTETIDTEALGLPILAVLSGTLIFTGRGLPEPGTWVLIALGLTGLIPLIRRRLKK